jgi:spore coat protein CotH
VSSSRATRRRDFLLASLGAAVCLTLAVAAAPAGAGARGAAPGVATGGDRSAKVFDPGYVHDVAFTVAPEHVDALRAGATERVPATMAFDGVTVDRIGLRLKGGFASRRELDQKAGFSIKTDRFVDKQDLHGIDRFTLGNSIADHSFVGEQVAYDVWRAAGIPAPRTALANVTFNGERYGLYVLREGYDKDFLRRHFADPDGNLYECPGDLDISDQRMAARTNEDTNDKADIAALAQVVENTPDDAYLAAVGELVDLDQVFRYWAVEALVAHFDGYVAGTNVPFGNTDPAFVIGTEWPNTPNNCYWYHDPRTGKFVVLPHGADWSMGNAIGLVGYLNRNTDPQYLDGEMLGGARFRTLTVPKPGARTIARLTTLPGTEDRLRSNVRWVVERAWNTPKLLARADKIAQLVRSNGPPTGREEWTSESFEEAFALRRSFIEHRAAEVRNELGGQGGG